MSKKAKIDALIKTLQAKGIKIDWCSRFPKKVVH